MVKKKHLTSDTKAIQVFFCNPFSPAGIPLLPWLPEHCSPSTPEHLYFSICHLPTQGLCIALCNVISLYSTALRNGQRVKPLKAILKSFLVRGEPSWCLGSAEEESRQDGDVNNNCTRSEFPFCFTWGIFIQQFLTCFAFMPEWRQGVSPDSPSV